MKPEKDLANKSTSDIELLLLEISELRGVLRELSQQVLRIERRVRAVLPQSEIRGRRQTQVRQSATSIIRKLTERARDGVEIEKDLRRMTVKHELATLARELGMTNTKLPPKDQLIRRISARIRQKVSVTSGIRDGVG